jgi:hypothetical protein
VQAPPPVTSRPTLRPCPRGSWVHHRARRHGKATRALQPVGVGDGLPSRNPGDLRFVGCPPPTAPATATLISRDASHIECRAPQLPPPIQYEDATRARQPSPNASLENMARHPHVTFGDKRSFCF